MTLIAEFYQVHGHLLGNNIPNLLCTVAYDVEVVPHVVAKQAEDRILHWIGLSHARRGSRTCIEADETID